MILEHVAFRDLQQAVDNVEQNLHGEISTAITSSLIIHFKVRVECA